MARADDNINDRNEAVNNHRDQGRQKETEAKKMVIFGYHFLPLKEGTRFAFYRREDEFQDTLPCNSQRISN